MKDNKFLWALLVLLFVVGCASTQKNRDAHKELRELISQNKFNKAITLVKSDSFYPEKRSRLLKLLELGTLYYLKNLDFKALETFKEAKRLSDKLYTKSISKEIKASISNENQNIYYGERYERSLLRYYLALIHFRIYIKGGYTKELVPKKLSKQIKEEEIKENDKKKSSKDSKKDKKIVNKNNFEFINLSQKERRQNLFAARAMILEWDSLLEEYKNNTAGEAFYKTDLLAKLLGALIHEQIGSRSDRNIAKQLYIDAKDVIYKYYNLLPSMNHNYESFSKNYEKLPKLKRSKVKKKYISSTKQSKNLIDFIDTRLKNLKTKAKDNTYFLINKGFINEKKVKSVDFPLPLVHVGVVNGNKTDLFYFTLEMLAISGGSKPTISFELPFVQQKSQYNELELAIYDENEKLIQARDLVLINPHSDLAWLSMENKRKNLKSKVGMRVAMKHVSAILASYKIYEAQPNALGKITAGIAYAASNKAIAASELADLRYWASLADSVQMTSLKINKNGRYIVKIRKKYKHSKNKKDKESLLLLKKKIEVKEGFNFFDLNLN